MRSKWLFSFSAMLLSTPAAAQTPENGTSPDIEIADQEIVVTGRRVHELLADKPWSSVHAAYRRYAARVAPGATVKLIARGAIGGGRYAFTLGRREERETRFPVDAGGAFVFQPGSPSRGERLYLSSGAPPQGLRFSVMTPGTSLERRRIGDIRLECQLWWAAAKHDTPFFIRAAAGGGGLCVSRRFGYGLQLGRPIVAAQVTLPNGSTRNAPVSRTGQSLFPPIWDASIPDDAVLSLR